MAKKRIVPAEYDIRLSRNCYYVCLGVGAFLVIGYIVISLLGISMFDLNPYPCAFYSVTGLYCPGCGGTRSLNYLIHGHLLKSLLYHPLVPYSATVVGCYVISHTSNIISKGKVRAMMFRPIYLYIAIGIVGVNWVVKNAIILIFGIHLLK